MTLQRYLENSWLQRHDTSRQEITELLAIADRDIGQSQTPGLGPEWRLSIAYNAALQLARAALAAAGYRAERQNKHQRTIESLAFTLGLERRAIDFLDLCRRKRHSNVYDQVGAVSEQEADEMIAFTTTLRKQVAAWLQNNHPRSLRVLKSTTYSREIAELTQLGIGHLQCELREDSYGFHFSSARH